MKKTRSPGEKFAHGWRVDSAFLARGPVTSLGARVTRYARRAVNFSSVSIGREIETFRETSGTFLSPRPIGKFSTSVTPTPPPPGSRELFLRRDRNGKLKSGRCNVAGERQRFRD